MEIQYALRDEKVNIFSMTYGNLSSEFSHQIILCKKTPFSKNRIGPFLLDTKRSISTYQLSQTGEDYLKEIKEREYDLKYIAYVDTQLKVRINTQLFEELCNKSFFNIWNPKAPYKYFEELKEGYLVVFRVYEIDKSIPESFLEKGRKGRNYYYQLNKNVNIEVMKPVIDDDVFYYMKDDLIKLMRSKGWLIEAMTSNFENTIIENDLHQEFTKVSNKTSIRDKFFEYIGPNNSLNDIQKSYKLILLLQLLNVANEEGRADYDKVCESICKMYLARHQLGKLVETKDTEIQKKIERLDKNIVKREMNRNPYKVIHKKGYIYLKEIKEIEYLCFDKALWHGLNGTDKEKLKVTLKDKLELYYRERVDKQMNDSKLKTYLEKIMDNYINAKKHESFGGHELGELFRKTIPEYLKNLPFIQTDQYQITGSIGQGNWANVPWIAVMNKKSTTSTQRGVYIVYLFSENMEKLYLTLNQGVTDIKKEFGKVDAKKFLIENAQNIRKKVDIQGIEIIKDMHISNGNLGEMYQAGTIASIEYSKGDIPDDDILTQDLKKMVLYYERYLNKIEENKELDAIEVKKEMNVEPLLTPMERIKHIHNYINAQGFTYSIETIKNFYISLKTKPFVLLAGISGTGKSKLAELFAEAIGATTDNNRYTIIPVRPDWSDPSDLLGYKNIEGKFQAGPLTNIIKEAVENLHIPYFICLDEMNLARVEYYFSDILSLMETRKKRDRIKTDKLLKDEIFGNDEEARSEFSHLYIPENLYIIGTVNMDETTFPFSKKVLDRGNTIEFNHVDLSLGIDILDQVEEVKPIDINNKTLCSQYLKLKDCLEHRECIENTVAVLEKINEVLEEVGLHFGYRVRDEIIFYIMYAVNEDLMAFDQAMDYGIIQKILPRIQGSNQKIKEILIAIYIYLTNDTSKEYDPYNQENSNKMYKYLNEHKVKYPLSSRKISKMMRRYESDGFTTFWE